MEFNQIKELLQINEEKQEAPSGPIELKDIAKYFPKNAQKAVNKMIETDRLVYDGKNIMDDLYSIIEKAAKKSIDRDLEADVSVHFSDEWEGEDDSVVEFDIDEVSVQISDTQEVYLGYYPKGDFFVMGFDAWMNEEDFWQKVESEAEKQGVDVDSDQWQTAANKLWKKVRDDQGMHVRVEVEVTNGKAKVRNTDSGGGVWYGSKYSGYGEVKKQYPDLLDIRLD